MSRYRPRGSWRFFRCFKNYAYLCNQSQWLRELSNFILTLPRTQNGAFFIAFGAVLLLSEKRKTANPLSSSGLGGSFMFNPKKLLVYNGRVTKGSLRRGFEGVFLRSTTQALPYNYIFFCCYFVAMDYLCSHKSTLSVKRSKWNNQ